MKAVITAAGLGTRSGLDGKIRKEMLPVYDIRNGRIVLRPIIDVIINNLVLAGLEEIAVVLDPQDLFTRNYIESNFPEAQILFQNEKRGYGHAVLTAKDFVGKGSFILNAGDGIVINPEVTNAIIYGRGNGNYLTLMQVEDPERYGTAMYETNGDSLIIRSVVEKAKNPPSNYALCAFYRLNSDLFTYLEKDLSANVELTPAINSSILNGTETRGILVSRKDWQSVSRAESYVEVLKATLDYCKKRLS